MTTMLLPWPAFLHHSASQLCSGVRWPHPPNRALAHADTFGQPCMPPRPASIECPGFSRLKSYSNSELFWPPSHWRSIPRKDLQAWGDKARRLLCATDRQPAAPPGQHGDDRSPSKWTYPNSGAHNMSSQHSCIVSESASSRVCQIDSNPAQCHGLLLTAVHGYEAAPITTSKPGFRVPQEFLSQ